MASTNDGTMTVTNSTFSENSADLGGGILNSSGTLKVINSTFSGNSAAGSNGGGGIFNAATLTVSNSTISGNTSGGDSGGIHNSTGGTLTLTNSTISGNDATADGGGMGNSGGATLKVINSTFSGNSATNAGGILNGGTLTVINSTISDNSATNAGGGILVAGSTATATLKNTIVANSTQGDCTIGFNGAVTDGGFNLIEDGSCITKNSSLSGDPLLGELAENGGPTQTMALQAGSPAIDQGKAFGGATTDQRGESRPHDFAEIDNAPRGDGSDIGAFEVQP